jgi:hypothetical protein
LSVVQSIGGVFLDHSQRNKPGIYLVTESTHSGVTE